MSYNPGRPVQQVEQTQVPVSVQEDAPVEVTAPAPLDVNVATPAILPVSIDAQTGNVTVEIAGQSVPVNVTIDGSQQPLQVQTQDPVQITDDGTPVSVSVDGQTGLVTVAIDAGNIPLPVVQSAVVQVTDDGTPILVDISGQPIEVAATSAPLQVEVVQPSPSVQVEPIVISDGTFEDAQPAAGYALSPAIEDTPWVQLWNPVGSGVDLLVETIAFSFTSTGGNRIVPGVLRLGMTQGAPGAGTTSKVWRDTNIGGAPQGLIYQNNDPTLETPAGTDFAQRRFSTGDDVAGGGVAATGGQPFITTLAPGWGLTVYLQDEAVLFDLNLRWSERPV